MALTETINKIAKGIGLVGVLAGSIISINVLANSDNYKNNAGNDFYSKLKQPQKTFYDYGLTGAMASALLYYMGNRKLIKKF